MTAADRSKWLDWKPEGQNIRSEPVLTTDRTANTHPGTGQGITAPLETELTKLTSQVGSSVSSGSVSTGKRPNILIPERDSTGEDFDPLDPLRQPFVAWFDSRVQLDAKGIALRQPPTWSTNIRALHRDCGAWMAEHSQVVPPTLREFRLLLQELGCTLFTAAGCEFVGHVCLRDDLDAHAQFQQSPLPEPGNALDLAVEQVLRMLKLPSPAPAPVIATAPDGTPLPVGVRIVRWEPVTGPVRISEHTVVSDVSKFIQVTLHELDHHLHGNRFMDGGWGRQGLIARLEAVGVHIEIGDQP